MKEPIARAGALRFGESLVGLAPLAGYTDAPFRLLCSEMGADFSVTEMVSAEGLIRGGDKTLALLRFVESEGPVGVQLFGADPNHLARAAAIAEEHRPAFIDLNFGCPVRKVVRKNGGAAIMRDLDLMGRIASAVAGAVSVPVTAKIRSGWSEQELNYAACGRVLEQSGIAAVTLHARTRSQGFAGEAQWSHIRHLREEISIPVIANGDVRTARDYQRIVEFTGAGAVMIGRGALGNPWIFDDIKSAAAGRAPRTRTVCDIIRLIERHVRLEAEWKGERQAVLEMRKQYRWYLRGIEGMRKYRALLCGAEDLPAALTVLEAIREECRELCKRPA